MTRKTTERGYGRLHQLARAGLLQEAYGQACHFCGLLMAEGQDLCLDHTQDRRGYRGMVHARCNYRDGAIRGNRMRARRYSGGAIPPA